MGKALAIDFGLKRSGMAISDEMKMFSFGIDTVDSDKLMSTIKRLVEEEKIDVIVLGYPTKFDGSDSHVTENVRLLKEALVGNFPIVKVELLDERLTSKMASQAMHLGGASKKQKKNKELVDKTSAVIILQSFLAG